MSLEKLIMPAIKEAMKSKDVIRLQALRAIKSAIILFKTQGKKEEISEVKETQILQKLVKQRNESASIYRSQNRIDLAEPEEAQAKVISEFLPEPLSDNKVEEIVNIIISEVGASGMEDMGKVMGIVTSKLSGKADGKLISSIVRKKLSI
ncbi:MAG: glutamyl-tRNA amidotransferase [Flavobacteriaceae bacterium]|nr:glutamyl-tRNA amidotransferase [Flavobacteriaceae bacterium]|tara:strand:+ start:440 stop:889 length:450 start_codon:yes stop_codon:yes gene_type:complete